MHLEEAMRHEILRIETEMLDIDIQLQKLQKKIEKFTAERKKKEHDLKALRNSFDESYIDKEAQEIIDRILAGQRVKP